MSRVAMGRVGTLLSRRCKQLQRKSHQRSYRKLFLHRPGMEGLEPRLMLARDLLVADIISDSLLRFDGDTGAPLGAFVTSGSGGLVDPLDPEFGPDGNLYVISNNPDAQQILRFDGTSGAFRDVFVDTGEGGFAGASAIEFGPDGNLYLATISDRGVLRFNGITGQPMGVAASGNGIRRASGISFGPDGKLYVLDSDSVINASADRVLRFDPSNGAFIDQFVSPGQLNDAVFLTFGPDNQLYVPDIQQFHDVRRFSGTTGKFLGVFANSPDPTNNPIFDIQFGPDGNAYAATGDGILRLDGETGQLLDTFVDGTGGSITFFPPLGPAADLSVSSIVIPVGVEQGNDLSISYTVTNNSASATVVNSWDDVVYLSTDDVFDPTDREFGRIARTTGLAGGANYSETLTAPLSNVSLGDYHVFVFADRRGVVNDTTRLNNLRLATSTLGVFPPLASTHDPDRSIVVGRTLSAYSTQDISNGQLTITYTVYNLTDGYVKGTLLTTTLGTDVTFVSASILPDRNGQELAWSMGTLAPYERASVAVSVALANLNTRQIDAGAMAFAMLDTVVVSDIAPGARLRTDIISPDLLASTPDANTTDPFVREKVAELDYDPQKIFDFLRTEIAYESYDGSLRGARGTLWSRAGNSLDEASLGVAMMRAAGIPARYVHGVLADGPAQRLILSMFPDAFQVVGYIPPNTEVADPANDPQLLAETKDHYWFQFNAGAGFQDADSTFADATIGQTFHNGATNGFTEAAEALRHKTRIQLTAEIYSQATAALLPGNALSQTVVLDKTFNDVDLVGRPLTLGYFANTKALSSLAFAFQSTTFTPYVIISGDSFDDINDETVPGKPFQEIFTNFPLGNQLVTGLFLTMNLISPKGVVQSYQRTLADRLGTAARANGSTIVSISPEQSPIATPLDLTTISVLTSRYDPKALLAQNSVLDALQQRNVNYKIELDSTPPGPKLNQLQASAPNELGRAFVAMGRSRLAQIAALSDSTTDTLQTQARVRAYFASPRVMLFSTKLTTAEDGSSTIQFAMDLRKDDIRVLAAPANAKATTAGFNLMRAFTETVIETQAIGTPPQLSQDTAVFTGPVSEATILEATIAQDIPLLLLRRDQIGVLNALVIPADVKALISGALQDDQLVLIPAAMVLIDGTPQIAWYEIDPSTGRTTGVGQNGLHSPLVSYTATQQEGTFLGHLEGFSYGVVGGASLVGYKRVIEYLLRAFIPIAVKGLPVPQQTASAIDALKKFYFFWNNVLPKFILALTETASPSSINRSIAAGFLVGLSIAGAQTADPPVNTFLSNPDFKLLPSEPNVAKSNVFVSNEVLPGKTTASLSLGDLAVRGQLSASWNAQSNNAFLADSLSSPLATILDSNGNTIGSGSVTLASPVTVPVVVSGDVAYNIQGQGSLSFYPPTDDAVGASGDWTFYSAGVSGTVELKLNTDSLQLNGNVLPAGIYRIIGGSATLSGSGRSTSPNFTGSVSIAAVNAGLELGKGIGSLSVGGTVLDPKNGTALAGLSGDLSVSLGSDDLYLVTLNGSASHVMQVSADSTIVTANQNATATFHIDFHTSLPGPYVLSVHAPKGWNVTMNGDTISITPAPGVQSGNFPIHVVAGSLINPHLVAQADLTVAVSPTVPAIDVTVTPDSILYVPVNGGQLPSAFQAHIQNLGPTAETLELTFNSPPGFEVISSMSRVTVPAGKTATVGFYFQPIGGLPPPGSNVAFTVTAISLHNAAITDTESVAFMMPEVHGVTLIAAPASISTIPGVSADAAFVVKAAGNVTENITFDVSLSPGLALAGLTNVSLDFGQSSLQTLHFTPLATTPLNSTLQATITAKFDGREPVTITIPVRVAVAGSDAIDSAGNAARSLDKTDLANRLSDLSIALTNLVQMPTSAIFKSQSLASLDSIENLLLVDPTLVSFSAPLANAAAGLANADTASEIQLAIVALGTVLDGFAETVIQLSRHNFEFFLTPSSQVALPRTPTQFELRIHNIGRETSTYNVALQDLPAGVTATLSDQQVTLDRDGLASVMVTLTQTSADELLQFTFGVDVSVDGAPQINKSASGTLTARREFVSVVSVTATPPFTDAGGTLEVSARLLNAVNREQGARASFVVRDSTGTQVGAAPNPVDVTLTVQTSLVTLPLGSIDTTGLANGSYSIVMTLVDVDGKAIPGGTGSTTFLVGSPLTASIDVAPSVLPPGTSTVSNTLKIEALAPLVSPPTLVGQASATGASDVVRNGDIVYVAGSNGISVFDIAGANLQNPQLLSTVGSATTLLEQRGDLLVSVLSRPGGGSTTLTTFSLSDPANPTQLGTTGDIPYGSAADLIVTDTHAFIVLVNIIFTLNRDIIDQNGGLIAINISNPAVPFFDGDAVSAKGTPAARDGVDDGVLFNDNGTNDDGIKNPLGIDQSGGNQNTWSVVQVSPTILLLSGSTATGTDTQSGVGVVRVVDISDPRNMRLLRDLQIPGTVHVFDVAVSGNRALLTASQGGFADLTQTFPATGNVVLATLNISDPASPQIIHQQTLDRAARGVDHVTTLDNGLYAIANLGAPTDQPRLFIVDATDPNNLGVGGIDAPAGINELVGGNGSIFTTDGASLIIYQVPPNSPLTLVGQVPISGGLRGVAARDNIAYASGPAGIRVIDYAAPENPVVVGTIPGNHVGARIQDNVLLALRPSGVGFILDVYALQNTPLAPPLIGSSPVIKYNLQTDLKSDSGHAYVTQFQTCFFLGSQDIYFQGGDLISIALNLDDVANPTAAAPALDSVLFNTNGDASPDPGDVSGCAQNGGDNHVTNMELVNASTAYLATTSATGGNTQLGVGRIGVIDISDTTNPAVLKNLDIPGTVEAIGIGVSGNVGVVIGSTGGFADNPQGILLGNLTVTTLDVSDPHDPKIITTRTLDRGSETFWSNFVDIGNGIFGFSNLGYHNGQSNPAVIVIDASNPRSPLIGQVSIPNELIAPNSLSTDGKFLFTADSGGVTIYTVNPLPGLPVTARMQIPNGTGVAPIPGSFNIPPAEVINGADFDTYVFDLTLAPSLPTETLTWQTVVVGLKPGDSRPVTLGTTIDFAFQGTAGQLALPRTVVAAEQALSLAPASQTVRPGGAAKFNVQFTNPAPVDVTYQISVGGVPSQWVEIDASVTVPAGGAVTKVLRLTTGAFDVIGDYGFVVSAKVDNVTASVAGTLVLAGAPILPVAKPDSQGVVINLTPTSAIAGQGTAATFVARLTNVGSQTDAFVLSVAGLPSGFQATFAANNISVPPGSSNFREVLLTIIPPQGTAVGDYAFTTTATSASDASIADVATSTLRALDIGVAVDVTPESGAPNSTYQMLVTNIGQVRETFDLSLAAPAALKATLGETSVTLDPGQSISIPIGVGVIDFAFPGSLSLVGVATSRSNPRVRAADGVGVDIAGLIAMTAAFDTPTQVLPLPGTSSFLLLVNNIGNLEDQYSATIKRTNGPITANLVGLQGERTQSVPLFILPGLSRGAILLNAELLAAGMGTITVLVKSLTDASVSTEITAQLQAGEQAPQIADLSLVMTVDNASAKVGQNVTFTIALNNAGPNGATGITVLDKLPTGLQFVSATTSTGNYSATTGLWNVGSLAQGATTLLTIVAKLLTDQAVSNVAQVATSDQRDPDSTPGNNVVGEDDQFSASVGTCLTGGPLVAGINRLVFSCVTPGGFAAFVVGSQPGSRHYSQWSTTVDIADPGVPAIGVGNINGVAVVLVNLTQAQLAQPPYVQAFEMLPAHRVSNLIVAQHAPEKTGTPLLADTMGLGSSPDTLAAMQAGIPQLKVAALSRWQSAGASALGLEHLAAIDIVFSDLPNDQLAATQGNFIVLDANAAGHGWFVDMTPANDVEFTPDASRALIANTEAARGHIDALTVILHEMGHVLGEPDDPRGSVNRLMSENLSPGMRRLPTAVTAPSFGALDVNRDGFVSPMDALLVINELNLSRGRFARPMVAGNMLDVTGDGMLTPNDALQVINYLNHLSWVRHGLALGEGESSAGVYDSDRGSSIALESSLVDDSLLEALAADAVNAWLEANRNSRRDLSSN